MSSAMRTRIALLCSLALLAAAYPWVPGAEAAQSSADLSDRIRATDKALRWLFAHQNADGGFGDPASDPQTTCAVILAFASAYEDARTVVNSGNSPLHYLTTQVLTQTNSAEGTALLILAVVAGNEDPRDFGSTDLIAALKGYRQDTGQYYKISSDWIAAQALAIMALRVSKETAPPNAVTWLENQQNDADDGWGPLPAEASDTENTALSIQALIAAGELPGSQPVQKAILYLQERQTEDAGFASSALASASDPASTSQAIQALLAAGEDLLSSKWRRCTSTPFDVLLDDQAGDGSFEGDVEITAGSVAGLMGRFLPLPGRGLAALRALEWLKTQQDTQSGSFGGGATNADAVFAIARAGQNPDGADWTENEISALEALESTTPGYIYGSDPAGRLAKVIRAVQAAQDVGVGWANPYNFAGQNLVSQLLATYNFGTYRYHPTNLYSHDLAILALSEVSQSVYPEAVTAIKNDQKGNGGWGWAWDASTPDTDATAQSMQALTAAGGPSSPDVCDNAAAFLQDLQFADGGFPDLATRPETNCNSTALAIQGLLAIGRYRETPLLLSTGKGGVFSSWDALLAFQQQSGSFSFTTSSSGSPMLATLDAIPALVSGYYPAYEPLSELDGTLTGQVSSRLTCGHGLQVVAPYTGDDDNDGWAKLRYHVVGDPTWNEVPSMHKGGLAYLHLLDLDVDTEYEVEVIYHDPDTVTGDNPQTITVQMGRSCIPVIMKDFSG